MAEEVEEQKGATAPTQPVPRPRTEVVPAVPSADASVVSKIDEESRTKLVQSLEAQKFSIIEELNNILDPLKDVIPDETVRYNTALNILGKKFPLTKLLEDYDRGLGVLDETQRQFKSALEEQLGKRVGSKIKNVEKFDVDIKNLSDEISARATRLTEMQALREAENSGISKEQARLDLTKERFDLAYGEIRGSLDRERQKVAKYGGAK